MGVYMCGCLCLWMWLYGGAYVVCLLCASGSKNMDDRGQRRLAGRQVGR